jgi:pimeloyl-ACP methyl ester carboxylesterase
VLFLPGIEASRLYRPDYDGGTDQLWEPDGDLLTSRLTHDANGESVNTDIYTRDIIDNAYIPVKGNIYKSFIETMDDLKSGGTINDWEAVPYDWRLSPDDILNYGNNIDGRLYYSGDLRATSTPYIIQELKRLATDSKTGKVTIIAHSNGGLITKRLTEILGPTESSRLIDKIIFVAVPQVGTPQAVAALLHGDQQGLPFDAFPFELSHKAARSLALNMPMTYNLLPSVQYFTYVDDPVITIDDSLPEWQAKYGSIIHSSERLRDFLVDTTRTKPAYDNLVIPEIGNETLFDRAVTLHATLDNWTPPEGVEFIQIAGWGIPTTRKGIHYAKVRKCAGYINIPGACDYVVDEFTATPKQVIDGDGTVVTPSALWTSTSTGVRNYWVDLSTYNDDHWVVTAGGKIPFKHANILEVNELRSFLADIIANSTQSVSEYTYLSTEAPPANDHRLRYSLHSPLTLDLYDDQGRHTGISTTTGEIEEEVPGAYYDEFGDVKYLYTNASTTSHIIMNGYATGTFTFIVDELQGDRLITSTTFKDLPTTPNTKVSLNVESDITTVSPMQIDINGDGILDFALPPPDLTAPATTATTSGTLGKNNWYTSNVLVTLSATDTDSGIASTTYSLNRGGWLSYSSPFTINIEGSTTVQYRSTDKAGNTEATKTLNLQIDKTAPEAQVSVSTTTQDLLVEGIDNLGTTTIIKNSTGYTITDQAGHTTTLFFAKTYSGKLLTFAKLTAIQYDLSPKTPLATSSFLYLWDTKVMPQTLRSQTIAVNDTFLITALYDKKTNKTRVIILKKKLPYQTLTFTGLKIVKLTTLKGVVGYGW